MGGPRLNRLHSFAAAGALCLALPLAAQPNPVSPWSGHAAVSVTGQSSNGSFDVFRTQTNLDEGLLLEQLRLGWVSSHGTEVRVEANAIGSASPWQSLRTEVRFRVPLTVTVDYDRRESFFGLAGTTLNSRRDDWTLSDFRTRLEWEGWETARLGLRLRQVTRSGDAMRPLFALNEVYPLAVDLDESLSEASFRIESLRLPLNLALEQSFGRIERKNRRRPAAGHDLTGVDPDLLADAFTDTREELTVPTTRLVASYGNDRIDVIGSALWSPVELDGGGVTSASFAVGGGAIGSIDVVDDVVTSAERDTLASNIRIGVRLAPRLTLRLTSDYRDSSTDATLLGERLLAMNNPATGGVDVVSSLTDSTLFDRTDHDSRALIEWNGGRWNLHAGGFTATREVGWTGDDGAVSVERDASGVVAGLAYRSRALLASIDYERGSFEEIVFRNEPETSDRLRLRLRTTLGKGWRVDGQARIESADNDEAPSDRDSRAFSVGTGWSSVSGAHSFGLDLSKHDVTTETGLRLPGGGSGSSLYDLDLVSATLHGATQAGPVRLNGSATRVDDRGSTWPLETWTVRGRAAFDGPSRSEISLFGEYWAYDETAARVDDFDVVRYGVSLLWRFDR